jgi:hypothetical protein
MIVLVNTVETGRGSRPTVEHWCNAKNNEAVVWRRGGPDGIKLKFDQARKFGRPNAGIEFIINSHEELDWETCETRVLTVMQAEFPEIDFADADIVEHRKEKADPTASRSHHHVFARAFSEETGRPIRLSHPYPRVEKICRIIEYDLEFAFVKGPNLENIIPRLRVEKRGDVADALRATFPPDDKRVEGNSFSPAVRQQVKRLVKQHYKSVTAISSDPEAARAALNDALKPDGIAIVVGPYIPPRWIVTKDGQTIGKVAGVTGEKIEDVETKLGDPANVAAAAIAAGVKFENGISAIEMAAKRAIQKADAYQHPESPTLTGTRSDLKRAKEDHSKVVRVLKKKQERLKELESLPTPSFFRFIKRMKHRKEIAKARAAVDLVDAKSKVTDAAVKAADNRLFKWKVIHDDDAAKGKAPLEQFAKTAKRNLCICERARAMVKEDPLLLRFSGRGVYALAEKSIDDDGDLQIAFDVTGLTTTSWKI